MTDDHTEISEALTAERPEPRPAFAAELRRRVHELAPAIPGRPTSLLARIAPLAGAGFALLALAALLA